VGVIVVAFIALVPASVQARGDGAGVAPIRPSSLAVSPEGALLIADAARNQILERLSDGRFEVIAGSGARGFSGDGGQAVRARLNEPAGMAVGADGTLFFADALNNRVRAISPNGVIRTIAGDGRGGWTRGGSRAVATPLLSPEAVAFGIDGRLYIAASGYGEVLRLERNGRLTRIVGIRHAGGVVGVGGSAARASGDGVNALAFDAAGDVFLAGFNTKALLEITSGGKFRLPNGEIAFYPRGPSGLASDSHGSVYGMNTQAIVRVTPSGPRTIYSFSGLKVRGITGFLPNGLAVSRSGVIYTDTAEGNGWANGSAIVVLEGPRRTLRVLWQR